MRDPKRRGQVERLEFDFDHGPTLKTNFVFSKIESSLADAHFRDNDHLSPAHAPPALPPPTFLCSETCTSRQ
jgi:hypothetical protein